MYTVIVDECTDLAEMEQLLALSLRYVDCSSSTSPAIKEELLCLVEVGDRSAAGLKQIIQRTLADQSKSDELWVGA